MRTHVKNVIKAVAAGNKEGAVEAYKLATPIIDRTANRGLIHPNKAARFKSRLNARVKAMA
jgi:small subunit ribosomal protein S20